MKSSTYVGPSLQVTLGTNLSKAKKQHWYFTLFLLGQHICSTTFSVDNTMSVSTKYSMQPNYCVWWCKASHVKAEYHPGTHLEAALLLTLKKIDQKNRTTIEVASNLVRLWSFSTAIRIQGGCIYYLESAPAQSPETIPNTHTSNPFSHPDFLCFIYSTSNSCLINLPLERLTGSHKEATHQAPDSPPHCFHALGRSNCNGSNCDATSPTSPPSAYVRFFAFCLFLHVHRHSNQEEHVSYNTPKAFSGSGCCHFNSGLKILLAKTQQLIANRSCFCWSARSNL